MLQHDSTNPAPAISVVTSANTSVKECICSYECAHAQVFLLM